MVKLVLIAATALLFALLGARTFNGTSHAKPAPTSPAATALGFDDVPDILGPWPGASATETCHADGCVVRVRMPSAFKRTDATAACSDAFFDMRSAPGLVVRVYAGDVLVARMVSQYSDCEAVS
jgi:hypothetical protein